MYNRRRKQEPNRTEQKLTSVTVIYGISLYAITYRVIAEALKIMIAIATVKYNFCF